MINLAAFGLRLVKSLILAWKIPLHLQLYIVLLINRCNVVKTYLHLHDKVITIKQYEKTQTNMITLTGFLRGINVGGHHKVPMAALRDKLHEIGCNNVRTLLNSGNFVFETKQTGIQTLEQKIEKSISSHFGFSIPVILRTRKEICDLVDENLFEPVNLHKDIRLYVSFLKEAPKLQPTVPYISEDKAFQIISIRDKTILSALDLSVTSTPKGMDDLEKLFGKNITTRNWNTIRRIVDI